MPFSETDGAGSRSHQKFGMNRSKERFDPDLPSGVVLSDFYSKNRIPMATFYVDAKGMKDSLCNNNALCQLGLWR